MIGFRGQGLGTSSGRPSSCTMYPLSASSQIPVSILKVHLELYLVLMVQIRLLRDMLEWGKDVKASLDEEDPFPNIVIVTFPIGKLQVYPSGTTAGCVIREQVGKALSTLLPASWP